jgi:hypothetical protein
MTPVSILTLSDLSDRLKVKLMLPVPLRAGDRLKLGFRLKRQHGGRLEVLAVEGEYRVASVLLSAEHQAVSVESVGKAPAWRAIRKEPVSPRSLSPARFAPTVVL